MSENIDLLKSRINRISKKIEEDEAKLSNEENSEREKDIINIRLRHNRSEMTELKRRLNKSEEARRRCWMRKQKKV